MRKSAPIVYVLRLYPRFSETFIAEEILALEKADLDIRIFALDEDTSDSMLHPVNGEIRASITYLPKRLRDEPLRSVRAFMRLARRGQLGTAIRARRHAASRRIPKSVFFQALLLAAESPRDATRFHAHFSDLPASVAALAHRIAGIRWSCSAHARDVWTADPEEAARTLSSAEWIVACTSSGQGHLRSVVPNVPVFFTHHGINLERFSPPSAARPARDGGDGNDPVRLLSVGRAVPKKGLHTLIDALALLPADLSWKLELVCTGPLLGALMSHARTRGVDRNIDWRGVQAQPSVLASYRAADLFVLPCRTSEDGDRDGLPNVLVEAQSQELACVSTTVSGVQELIVDGENGLLVSPEDPQALAAAIERLARNPELRLALGRAGAMSVRARFDISAAQRMLVPLLTGSKGPRENST